VTVNAAEEQARLARASIDQSINRKARLETDIELPDGSLEASP